MESGISCWVCTDDGGELIQPCGCSGSIGIHLKCMAEYILKCNKHLCPICKKAFKLVCIQRCKEAKSKDKECWKCNKKDGEFYTICNCVGGTVHRDCLVDFYFSDGNTTCSLCGAKHRLNINGWFLVYGLVVVSINLLLAITVVQGLSFASNWLFTSVIHIDTVPDTLWNVFRGIHLIGCFLMIPIGSITLQRHGVDDNSAAILSIISNVSAYIVMFMIEEKRVHFSSLSYNVVHYFTLPVLTVAVLIIMSISGVTLSNSFCERIGVRKLFGKGLTLYP